MKKRIITLMVIALISIFGFNANAKDLKIGYVDVMKVFNEYKKTKEYDSVLEKRKTEKETKLKEEVKKIEEMQNKLNSLGEKEKTAEKSKIDKAQKDYKNLEWQSVSNLRKERDDKMKEIIADINKIIKDYAEKNAFDLIVNESTVLYGNKTMDITDVILKLVNEKS